jgi:site-specific DNA-cytosine methylase
MELAGHECVGFCEFDKYAVMSYTAMHLCTQEQLDYLATLPLKQRQKEILKDEYKNGEWYANDVRRVDARSIPDADCWCFGFPCFTGDTLVLTYDGYKEIKDVAVGDKVLTHTGKWQRVTSVMKRDNAELWEVRGFGILPTLTTEGHPYYLTKDKVNYEWVKVKDIGDDYYSTLTLPKTIDSDNHTAEWWWVAGRYLADGWTIKRKDRNCGGRVVIACNDEKLDDICKRIKEAGFNYSVSAEQTCNKVHITNNGLYEDLQMFGKYAYGKNVPGSVLELPIEKATAFYNGYMSGDGRCDKEEATSVSPYLILGMALVAIKIGKNHPGIYKTTRNSKCVIEGRECNQRDTYTFRVCNRSVKSSESNGIWCRRINRPVNTSMVGTVYNISVEEDESYIANGAIVHNCQDISVAGKQAGFNGTRSSLFFEVMRLLDEREANGLSVPGYLFIENVKNLLSVNRGIDFAKVLFALDERGYDSEWQVLNSKNFNVPQNRERVFVVGHLRGRSTAEVFPVEGADGTDSVYGVNQIGLDGRSNRINPNQYRVYDPDGISPCLNQMGGGGLEPHIIDPKYYKLEGGVRVYENCTPTLTSRDYKDPLMVTQDVGINPTLTCNKQEGNRIAVPVEVKPEVIGGIGEKSFGQQYPQGNRIYDGDKIATALQSNPVGNCGGSTNLYSVDVTGYNATLKRGGGCDRDSTCPVCEGRQRIERKSADDDSCSVFAIDK